MNTGEFSGKLHVRVISIHPVFLVINSTWCVRWRFRKWQPSFNNQLDIKDTIFFFFFFFFCFRNPTTELSTSCRRHRPPRRARRVPAPRSPLQLPATATKTAWHLLLLPASKETAWPPLHLRARAWSPPPVMRLPRDAPMSAASSTSTWSESIFPTHFLRKLCERIMHRAAFSVAASSVPNAWGSHLYSNMRQNCA